jgi:hypothetical protein
METISMPIRSWSSRILFVTSLALGACASAGRAYHDRLAFDLDGRPWKEAYHAEVEWLSTTEFVLPGDTITDWHELVTIQTKDREKMKLPPVGSQVADLRGKMLARCPAATWTELAADSSSVLYEWRISSCAGQDDQHELSRMFDGPHTRVRVAYTRKGGAMPDSIRTEWIERLRAAKFVAVQP